jgi:predicted TPR repeat methyltransferase
VSPPDPWSLVAAAEFEAHLGAAGEDLLAPLAAIFGKVYAARRPRRLAILGVATGGGLEHVDPARTARVLGVDANLSHLGVARQRFMRLGPALELVCAEPGAARLAAGAFDLVYAALALEHLDLQALLPRVAAALAPGGAFAAVLRLARDAAPLGASPPLRAAAAAGRLVPPAELRDRAARAGLAERKAFEVRLAAGRRLFEALWERGAR